MSTTTSERGLSALRSTNRRRLLDALGDHGQLSRAQLARMTHLSGTTVSSLVSELTDEGVVSDVGHQDRGVGRTGRPGRLVQLVGDRSLVVGVDLGHDVVRAAVCQLSGAVVAEHTSSVDVDEDGADALRGTARLVNELVEGTGLPRERFSRLVVGVPGVVNLSTGRVVSVRMPRWVDLDPTAVLRAATGLETTVENDADLSALGEQEFGAARGLTDLVYVKASVGLGAGLILAGRLYRGVHGGAGELGHVQVSELGDLCVCGNRGCLETAAALAPVLAALRVVHPHVRTPDDLAALIAAGDRAAIRAVTDAGMVIGKAVADLCNILAPQAVIVGGELAGGGTYLAGAIQDAVERYTKPYTARRIDVLPSALGARAAMLGAVAMAAEAEARG